jgi:hypothetical protein
VLGERGESWGWKDGDDYGVRLWRPANLGVFSCFDNGVCFELLQGSSPHVKGARETKEGCEIIKNS